MRVFDIIESEAPLYAKPSAILRTISSLYGNNLIIMSLIGYLASHATIRAYTVDFSKIRSFVDSFFINPG